MTEILSPAVLDEQMPADQIGETGTVSDAIMPGYRASRLKLGACEEISQLLDRSAVLQGDTRQAGQHVIEPDQFRRAVSTLEPEEELCGVFVVVDTDVKRPLTGDLDLLGDVGAASRKSPA